MFDLNKDECQKALRELAEARQGVVDALTTAHETHKKIEDFPGAHNAALHELETAREREEDAWKMIRRHTEPTP